MVWVILLIINIFGLASTLLTSGPAWLLIMNVIGVTSSVFVVMDEMNRGD